MKRKIHIYQSPLSEELSLMFQDINPNITVESITEDTITVLDSDYYNEEPFDFEQLYDLLLDDFSGGITMMIEPYTESLFALEECIKSFIKTLPYQLYTFEDIITYSVIKNNLELKEGIIKYLNDLVHSEVIHTVRSFIENNMNSSTTAKKMYMHRNTLNYRIDNFIEATKINVKTFKGANAIYMLYNYS